MCIHVDLTESVVANPIVMCNKMIQLITCLILLFYWKFIAQDRSLVSLGSFAVQWVFAALPQQNIQIQDKGIIELEVITKII